MGGARLTKHILHFYDFPGNLKTSWPAFLFSCGGRFHASAQGCGPPSRLDTIFVRFQVQDVLWRRECRALNATLNVSVQDAVAHKEEGSGRHGTEHTVHSTQPCETP